ncbi:MAG: acetylglutamate kinase [Phycisphaerales bacterium]|nr:acetylglutamate kinase [Phycisphaerales bacterium]
MIVVILSVACCLIPMHTTDLSTFRNAIPYIRAYKGRTFVIKFGGRLCETGPVLDHLVEQCSLLYQLGIQVVLVHGGGEQVNALCERMGVVPRMAAGRRITDAETLQITKMVFAGAVNTDVLAACRAGHLPAMGLSGVDAALVSVRRRPPVTVQEPASASSSGTSSVVDYGFVGDVIAVNPTPMLHLLAGGFVPVVCSLAADDAGQVYNVNADTIASALAVALKAAKYFLLTTVDGVMGNIHDPATLFSQLSMEDVANLVAKGVISGGMLPKMEACLAALRGGVDRVHIVNGASHNTLLAEVFTNSGCGTLITARRNLNNGTEGAPPG